MAEKGNITNNNPSLENKETPSAEIQALMTRAEQGDAKAQSQLALCYYNGDGIPADIPKALDLYRKAAAQNEPAAQFAIAEFHYNGAHGFPQDQKEAFSLFLNSAKHDYPFAIRSVTLCYYYGSGTTADIQAGYLWYKKLLQLKGQDAAIAQYTLGLNFFEHKNRPEILIMAFNLFMKATQNGSKQAALCVGDCLIQGYGTERNPQKAAIYYYAGRSRSSLSETPIFSPAEINSRRNSSAHTSINSAASHAETKQDPVSRNGFSKPRPMDMEQRIEGGSKKTSRCSWFPCCS